MRKRSEEELAALLAGSPPPRAPADLAARIKSEIPDRITLSQSALGRKLPAAEHASFSRPFALLVALLLVTVGLALLQLRALWEAREEAARAQAAQRLFAGEAPAGDEGAPADSFQAIRGALPADRTGVSDRARKETPGDPFVDPLLAPSFAFPLTMESSSAVAARRLLAFGRLPPRELIRVAAFVSSFDYGDPAPRQEELAIIAEGAPAPFPAATPSHVLRFTVRARGDRPTPQVVALEAQAALEVNPRTVRRYRVVGHERPASSPQAP
ncbi:MAG: von Willebrand factor type A domain-containing protein, partial [Acidobacteriota bacterium]